VNRTFSFFSEFLSKAFSVFRPKRGPKLLKDRIEAELSRLAESQYAAREERVKLSEEVARLRRASASRAIEADPQAESQLTAELAAELGQDQ